MLPVGKSKLCNSILMKIVEDIIKDISSFIQYWERPWVVDVGRSFCHIFPIWIG